MWQMFATLRWWIFIVFISGVLPPCCLGVHVYVRDDKRYAVLFQSVVLPCQYTSVSTQTPVVQWVYKSYCRDRTRDSFSIPDSLGGGMGGGGGLTGGTGGGGLAGGGYETGMTASYLDCSDSSRTVRTVASISGSAITLSEYYKNRDISIINKADLRIGEIQWGDSGVYVCKVTISDDLEGQNEAPMELLVLGLSGVPEDLLPDFDLKIMPEWVFVSAVALGSVLFLLLVGVCWCQCCPHSCCCYVSCWCCPDTCCCPRHLYEAGKGIKTGTSTPQTPAYPPYFVSGVPTMVPIAPPSLVDKMSSIPPSDGSLVAAVPMHAVGLPYRVPTPQDQDSLRVLQYVEKQLAHFNPARSISRQSCSQSELSSLHEGEPGFRQTYRNIQKKALPAIPDHDPQPQPQRYRDNRSPEPQRYRDNLPSPQHRRDEPSLEPRRCQEEPSSPRRYSDDPPSSSSQSRRVGHNRKQQQSHSEEENPRWNPRSEHLHRKTYRSAGRTGSLDELEEFATSYKQREGRSSDRKDEDLGDYEIEVLELSHYPSHRKGPAQHYYNDEDEFEDERDHEDYPRRGRNDGHYISPLPSPKKRRGTWDSDRPAPPPPRVSPPSTSSQERDYDGTFLNSLLERKAKLRGVVQERGGARAEDNSDTPSKSSSKKSSGESSRLCSRSPSNRPEDSLPPCSDTERSRTDRPSPRPSHSNTHSPQPPAVPQFGRRDDPRDKSRKVSTLLSRDSLIV